MEKNNQYLGTEPLGKLLFKLAVPSVVAQIINMLYNIVDRIYIGHMAEGGSLALTGLGVCMPIIMVVSAFAALVSMGGAPRASIAMGRGDNSAAEYILGNCFVLQIIISAILTSVLLIWDRDLLLAFGASPDTIEFAAGYMDIYATGTIFVQLTLGMNAFITAQGFSKTSMYTVLIGAVSNIILDPVFIFGFGMGVQGAALATVISQCISCVWVLFFLSSEKTILKLKKENMHLKAKVILPCLALGLAAFIMQSSESIISVSFNTSLLKYGGDIAVGAMTILSSINMFAMLPLQGLGQGAQPIVSYNYGAKDAKRVRGAFRLLLKSSLIYATALWLIIMLLPQVFTSLFTTNAELAAFTQSAMRRYFAVMFMFGIQIACQMTFTAIGSAKSSIAVAVVRKFVLLLPLIYLMPALFPADKAMAVYLAEPAADFIAVTFTAILFSIQFKRAMDKLPNS
ncbi:MAG: MATE family efflux transporter [Eubacteriales bacterium]|nr:MATE family efflux transporter [Clostridiales bacterium]MDY5710564.1 MATE family efflux transporter [Eubacteriales bacterium]